MVYVPIEDRILENMITRGVGVHMKYVIQKPRAFVYIDVTPLPSKKEWIVTPRVRKNQPVDKYITVSTVSANGEPKNTPTVIRDIQGAIVAAKYALRKWKGIALRIPLRFQGAYPTRIENRSVFFQNNLTGVLTDERRAKIVGRRALNDAANRLRKLRVLTAGAALKRHQNTLNIYLPQDLHDKILRLSVSK